jgi:hypothetical protein
LNVFITIDTEAYPRTVNWRETSLTQEIAREVFGKTSHGEFGICFMADKLNAYGLKGVFFVESLFASAVGLDSLRSIVNALRERNQDVQLHLHPEWLKLASLDILGGHVGYNLKEFSEEEQCQLVLHGLRNLAECGITNVRAFRTGNFGASFVTLRAVAKAGIPIDSSYLACALGRDCEMSEAGDLLHPTKLEGVYEFPVSSFEDGPHHRRPGQICACSIHELQKILLQAWSFGWHSVVLLTHSFELINNRKNHDKPCTPSFVLVNRFERLCRFLAVNADKFHTRHFSDFNDFDVPMPASHEPLHSSLGWTILRYGEQLASRFF